METDAKLTVQERACLLRAAREKLAQMQDRFSALQELATKDPYADVLLTEINCLTAAITWLWQLPTV